MNFLYLNGCVVFGLREELLPDDGDDDEGTFVQVHRLQLPVCRLQVHCNKNNNKLVSSE